MEAQIGASVGPLYGLDLDRRTSRGIAPDPGFAIDQNELAQSRKGEAVLGVLVGQFRDKLQNLNGLPLGEAVPRMLSCCPPFCR